MHSIQTSRRTRIAAVALASLLTACGGGSSVVAPVVPPVVPPPVVQDTAAPPLQREMRGVWIATVANIDWPSRTGLTPDQQRAELVDIFDRAVAAGLNAVMFHVRPAGDAVYASTLEPWASMLSGTQGVDPGFDPLAYAVTQAHQRGLEIHAWINPFRAGNSRDTAKLAPTHQFTARRDLLRVYGAQLWFDPGEPAVHDHAMRVISDITRRYDVDGIHADDYFYPYQERNSANVLIDFPDSASYARSGSTLSRADWRRANVDRFVERMYREVHAIKPTMKVGLSPFGIWRPGNPVGVTGLDAFATIYADSRKWLQQGWVDYLAPQLYWAITGSQSYPALLDWWLAQNSMSRHVWPGLATYRVNDGTASSFTSTEIPNQVTTTRARPAASGHILYNTTTTLKKSGGAVVASLASLYATRALVPAYPWLDASAPPAPSIAVQGRSVQITPGSGEAARWWAVRYRAGGTWTTRVIFGDQRSSTLDADPERVLVNAVDQSGNASAVTSWVRP